MCSISQLRRFRSISTRNTTSPHSDLLKIVTRSIEHADSLRDMVAALNADPILPQALEYGKPVQQPQLSRDLQQWALGMLHQILQTLVEQAKRLKVFKGLNHMELIRNLAGRDLTFVLGN